MGDRSARHLNKHPDKNLEIVFTSNSRFIHGKFRFKNWSASDHISLCLSHEFLGTAIDEFGVGVRDAVVLLEEGTAGRGIDGLVVGGDVLDVVGEEDGGTGWEHGVGLFLLLVGVVPLGEVLHGEVEGVVVACGIGVLEEATYATGDVAGVGNGDDLLGCLALDEGEEAEVVGDVAGGSVTDVFEEGAWLDEGVAGAPDFLNTNGHKLTTNLEELDEVN